MLPSVLEHEIEYLVPASNAAALVAWTSSVCLRDGRSPPATVHTVYAGTRRRLSRVRWLLIMTPLSLMHRTEVLCHMCH